MGAFNPGCDGKEAHSTAKSRTLFEKTRTLEKTRYKFPNVKVNVKHASERECPTKGGKVFRQKMRKLPPLSRAGKGGTGRHTNT